KSEHRSQIDDPNPQVSRERLKCSPRADKTRAHHPKRSLLDFVMYERFRQQYLVTECCDAVRVFRRHFSSKIAPVLIVFFKPFVKVEWRSVDMSELPATSHILFKLGSLPTQPLAFEHYSDGQRREASECHDAIHIG